MNYLTYPTKTMNITQGYSGSTSHAPHSTGSPTDYPIDEACKDGGRDWFYCPCDEMKIVNIYGVNNSRKTNTIWMTSTAPVIMPVGTYYVTILVTHPNDDDLAKLRVGQKFTRGEKMFREGNDGNATGYHFHIAVGSGTFLDPGWGLNNNGAWVLKTTGKNLKPEEAFYLDKSFTTLIKKSGNIAFTAKPIAKTIDKNYAVNTDVLNIRSGAGLNYGVIGTYKRGTVVHADMYVDGWIHTALGWVSERYTLELLPGDVDLDGKITAEDARLANRAGVGLENLSEAQKTNADINGDGKVTSADARKIIRKSVGLED